LHPSPVLSVLQLFELSIRAHFAVLAHSQQRTQRPVLTHGPHLALHGGQPLANGQDLALDLHRGAQGDGLEVGAVERPADAHVHPEAGLVDELQGPRGARVEDGRRAAAVQVAHLVAVDGLHREAEVDARVGLQGVRVDGEVGDDFLHPVLSVMIRCGNKSFV
jgi:hypothetical protein